MNQSLAASPHAHAPVSVGRTMALVMVALVPATLFGLYQFGWPAIFVFTVTLGSTAAFEALSLLIAGRAVRPALMDGSALLTGWLLALTLPPWAPWWVGVIGGLLAVVLGKQVFGGIGQNLFNPAMIARVALLISFPVEMTRFLQPQPLFSAEAPGFMEGLAITFGGQTYDAITGASLLGHVRTELGEGATIGEILPQVFDPLAALLGTVPGALGETSALLLGLGGLFLLYKRVIAWQIPAAMLGTIVLLATLMSLIAPDHYPGALYHVLSGATVLCAFFIATDPVTSPVSLRGQLLFGAGVGLLVYVIRTWGGYPEGIGFAVLLMNACTPMIDHYLKPRIYGRDRRGRPLDYGEQAVNAAPEKNR
ncbi:MAG: RnfABCDGE type electron transport complex subunit D [Thiohalocapsa sp.]|nr:RnfABCDGE type electron transport complex subunit D [Thiohalocapsa sp.]MCF7989300.1 RnfABCDGE type electron transport complex subunit D [Thiohalocapsa sp.]